MSSIVSEGSDYSPKKTDYETDDYNDDNDENSGRAYREFADAPTVELKPVPMSKNGGNRFLAFIWDKTLKPDRDVWQLQYEREALTEDHVMFCRKRNLYNETVNTDSMVDILWSYPILASDLQRVIGHAMCMESTKLEHVHELLKEEPIIQSLTGGDISNIPLYRWRHIRDYTLRQDDGRFGTPAMMIGMDHHPQHDDDDDNMFSTQQLRQDMNRSHYEYLIRSERVIAAGPLHVPTQLKDDPSSVAVGNLVLFNAKNRSHAIEFCENDPYSKAGLYGNLKVHFYNNLDVTGKFVSESDMRDAPCAQMQEALGVWGYPIDDDQTKWLNW